MPKELNDADVRVRKELGKRLKFYRTAAGLSQAELEKAVNLRQGMYTHYETGKCMPTLNTLRSLAIAFGTDVEMLLDDITAARDDTPAHLTEAEKDKMLFSETYEQRKLYRYFKKELDGFSDEQRKELRQGMTRLDWVVTEQVMIYKRLYNMICRMGLEPQYLAYEKNRNKTE